MPDSDVDRSLTIDDFAVVRRADTRWADNDMFGHLNNAVYYQLFDSAINGWVLEATGVTTGALSARGVVAESGCKFFREVGFPDAIVIGIRIAHLGRSSVIYELGLFSPVRDGDPDPAVAALGRWVHVYVDPAAGRPVSIPEPVRSLLELTAAFTRA
ncbi:thioesterase family protein [Arthrobacter sp. BE255]|uniref:acyl-CoA thioesterase n=1 Tax=Arthrobacter sp. BE255 TaxID=2817721 RepID=UPI00285E5042|nr:thioesterase family protein [Arthrobacter sp. BE255]MDR7159143.1 acyl-CoA thioester hydrolase [Arthrobacter sp. BE255]